MSSLVSNGTYLYRRNSSLVRSPVYVTEVVQPDQRAYYYMTDNYVNAWPRGGVVKAGDTMAKNQACNDDLINLYFNGHANQKWHPQEGAGSITPMNVWYSGTWSTFKGIGRSEACECVSGAHFTLPTKFKDKVVDSIKWTVQHYSTIVCYQSPGAKSSNNFFAMNVASKGSNWVKTVGDWASGVWTQNVGFHNRILDDIRTMYNNSQGTIDLESDRVSGNPTGYQTLWTSDASPSDGKIPSCTIPYTVSYQLTTEMVNAFNTNGGGWLVSIPLHGKGTTVSDWYPRFHCHLPLYWICCSFRTMSIAISLKLYD